MLQYFDQIHARRIKIVNSDKIKAKIEQKLPECKGKTNKITIKEYSETRLKGCFSF